MANINTLEHDVLVWALVGRFLQRWAFMEVRANRAIEATLGLTTAQGLIVATNVQLRDKVYILRSLLHFIPMPPTEQTKIDATLKDILDSIPNRNMMAHNPFGQPEDVRGVEFRKVQARESLKFQDIVWPVERFEQEHGRIARYNEDLERLISRASAAKPKNVLRDLLDAWTIEGSAPQGPSSPPSPQPQDSQNSNRRSAIPKKESETPQEPEE